MLVDNLSDHSLRKEERMSWIIAHEPTKISLMRSTCALQDKE